MIGNMVLVNAGLHTHNIASEKYLHFGHAP